MSCMTSLECSGRREDETKPKKNGVVGAYAALWRTPTAAQNYLTNCSQSQATNY